MAKVKIKRGDNVIVTTGKNKGSKGEVLEVIKKENADARVIVAGVNVVKKHVKPSLHSLFSSCAVYFFVFNTNLPYIGCFILIVSLTTMVFSILLLETIPILSFLKFLSMIK